MGGSSSNNNTASLGGAVYVKLGLDRLNVAHGSSMSFNTALGGSGGAVRMDGSGTSAELSISGGSQMDGNQAFNGTGGAYSTMGNLVLLSLVDGSSVCGNKAINGDGGGLFVYGNLGTVLVANSSSISSNSAGNSGGGVGVAGDLGNITVTSSSSIGSNIAGGGGGGVFAGQDLYSVTVAGGSNMDNNTALLGGAVYVREALGSVLVANSSSMSLNTALDGPGGAVRVDGSGASSELLSVTGGSWMDANKASDGTGGAYSTMGRMARLSVVDGSTISNNTATSDGGAVYVFQDLGSVIVANNSSMSYNAALKGSGGAVRMEGRETTNMLVSGGSWVHGNNAFGGTGGAYSTMGGMARLSVVDGSTISSNTATSNGGAIYVLQDLGNVTVANSSSISYNAALHGSGGAIMMHGNGTSDVLLISGGSQVDGNKASGGAGGAYSTTGSLTQLRLTENSSLSSNTCDGGPGGAVYVHQALESITVALGSNVSLNSALSGPGGFLCMMGDGTSSNFNTASFLVSSGSHVDGNTAFSKGGSFYTTRGLVEVVLTNGSSISNNTAGGGGGAFYGTIVWTIGVTRGSYMSYNSAGGAGGAINMEGLDYQGNQGTTNTSLTVFDDSQVDGNTAVVDGGAYYTKQGLARLLVADNSSISNNTAVSGSGGALNVRALGSVMVHNGSRLRYNNALNGHGGSICVEAVDSMLRMVTSLSISFGSQWDGNVAGLSGGAFYTNQGVDSLIVTNNSHVEANVALRLDGGAFFVQGGLQTLTVADGSSVNNNTAGENGGALYVPSIGNMSICSNSQMSYNEGAEGGAVFVAAYGQRQGLVDFLLCNASTIHGNKGRSGSGGAFYLEGWVGSFRVSESSMSHNVANKGGGVFLQSMFGQLHITGSNVVNNSALTTDGGFFSLEVTAQSWLEPNGPSRINIERSNISSNTAHRNGGGFGLFLTTNVFNTAKATEAQHVQENRQLKIVMKGSTLEYNRAMEGVGGALSVVSALVYKGNCCFTPGNMAIVVNIGSSKLSHNSAGGVGDSANSAASQPTLSAWRIGVRDGTNSSIQPAGYGGALFLWSEPAAGVGFKELTTKEHMEAGAQLATPPLISLVPPPAAGESILVDWDLDDEFGNASNASIPWPAASMCRLLLDGDTLVDSNRAIGGHGGGALLAGCAGRVLGSRFSNNTSTLRGGGLASLDLSAAGPLLAGTFQEINQATTSAPASKRRSMGAHGRLLLQAPGLSSDGGNSSSNTSLPAAAQPYSPGVMSVWLAILDTQFAGNSATEGGGLHVQTSTSTRAIISNCSLVGNVARLDGGGLHVLAACGGHVFVGNGSTFDSNQAMRLGGGCSVHIADRLSDNRTAGPPSTDCMFASNMTGSPADLELHNALLWNNTAHQGGGVHLAEGVDALISDCLFEANKAKVSGGAVGAVKCSMLVLTGCHITGCIAGLSGGGLYADACWQVLAEHSNVSRCNASAGGGVHLSAGVNNATAGYKMSSMSRATAPVALFSHVNISANSAVDGNYTDVNPSAADLVILSYGGHGGGYFVSGNLGIIISNSTVESNSANLGTAIASTQECMVNITASGTSIRSQEIGQQQQAAGRVPDGLGRWLVVLSALQSAVTSKCSLLVVNDVWLSLPNVVNNDSKNYQPPLLWLQDLTASALQMRCSSSLDETEAIHMMLQQWNASVVPMAGSSSNAGDPYQHQEYGGSAQQRSTAGVLAMLRECAKDPFASNGSSTAQLRIIEVPPAGLHIAKVHGVGVISSMGQQLSASAASDGGSMIGRNWSAALIPGNQVLLLLITPGSSFDLEIQLYDGLGQPVLGDTPKFAVNLTIRPALASTDLKNVSLLSSGGPAGSFTPSTTSLSSWGIASWTSLELRGWPGLYKLEVNATQVLEEGDTTQQQYQVDTLIIVVELLACEVGTTLEVAEGQSSWISCTTCRQGQLGLWIDDRPPLANISSTSDYGTLMRNMSAATEKLLAVGPHDDDDAGGGACPACCQTCPSNAVCPGGMLVVPEPGFWHSAANSPLIHRCLQPKACGNHATGGDHWDATVAALRNNGTSGLAGGAHAIDLNLTLSTHNRSLALGLLQQWWQGHFPQQQMLVAARYGANAAVSTPCVTPSNGSLDTCLYMDLQCAAGYKGNLCATCEPGYTRSADFECSPCPALARTVGVGLLAILGAVALIMYTTFSNLGQSHVDAMEAHEVSSLDVLKVIITHTQYFLIITRLNIDYPSTINRFQSVIGALTGVQNYIAYSPSCLYSGLDSAGQAAVQVLFGFATPCVVAVIAMALWALRHTVSNQGRLRRSEQLRQSQATAVSPMVAIELAPPSERQSPISEPNSQYSQRQLSSRTSQSAAALMNSKHLLVLVDKMGSERVSLTRGATVIARKSTNDAMAIVRPEAEAAAGPSFPNSLPHIQQRNSGTRCNNGALLHHQDGSSEDEPQNGNQQQQQQQHSHAHHRWVASQPFRSLMFADQSLSLVQQLGVCLLVASFILYPSLCQVSLSIFTCYVIDTGKGVYSKNQMAGWERGYWVPNLQQQCWDGVHLKLYLPIGIASVVVFCLGPPLTYFVLIWRACKHFEENVSMRMKYGFLYSQYKPRFFWWATVLQLQTLALLAVNAFGRTQKVLRQALLLSVVLIGNAAITMTCSPMRFRLIMVLDFLSSAVLSLTISLSLFLLNDSSDPMPAAAVATIGVVILLLNSTILGTFFYVILRRPVAFLVARTRTMFHTGGRKAELADDRVSVGTTGASRSTSATVGGA